MSKRAKAEPTAPFEIEFDPAAIKHLGLQMYSTLPPVIGELISNAWDADASSITIEIPDGPFADDAKILVWDDGLGMSDAEVRKAYLVIGRDRRVAEGTDLTPGGRRVMGRKGIGKFSAFGIAEVIEVESVKAGTNSRFIMRYQEFQRAAAARHLSMPALPPSGDVREGTRITLSGLRRFQSRGVQIPALRRAIARRFSIIDDPKKFKVIINGTPIDAKERDLRKLLDKDCDGKRYLWEFDGAEITPGSNWKVTGWIGALDRTAQLEDGIQRGVSIFARGKMVQEPFVFDAVVGQQFALSYLVGELHAEFVDQTEDTISTARNSLVWHTEANAALKEWGASQVNRIAREWAARRQSDNEAELEANTLYKKFQTATEHIDNTRAKAAADSLIRSLVKSNPVATPKELTPLIEHCISFVEFDAFRDLAEDLRTTNHEDIARVVTLFREWELVEAKEMLRVTEGRIRTIEKLQRLIRTNALEVPILHEFLKEFPWVLDPRWTLVADEVRYSDVLRKHFPEPKNKPEVDKRIDFLCVCENTTLVVVEIKRPHCKASKKELEQVLQYVEFMREHVSKTTDPAVRIDRVVGYLLVGDLVSTGPVIQRMKTLEKSEVYVRRYKDLLMMVEKAHKDFLDRYNSLKAAKRKR